MKIDVVTLSTNDNPLYCDFWEPISKFWKTIFDIHPVLTVHSNNKINLNQKYGDIHYLPIIENIPISFQTLWGRMYITKFYLGNICLVGDIDMAPLSPPFFKNALNNYDDNVYTHLNYDAFHPNVGSILEKRPLTIPGCWHVARGLIYFQVYQFKNWKEEIETIFNMDFPQVSNIKEKWGLNEAYSTEKIREYRGKITFEKFRMPRIDRSKWEYDPKKVKEGYYRDSHLLRPYKKNKEKIDKLLNLFYNDN